MRRGDAAAISLARAEFARRHLIRIPQFLGADLLDLLLALIDRAPFVTRVHRAVHATDAAVQDPHINSTLFFVMNDLALLSLVEELTGVEGLGSLQPVVYKIVPRQGHADHWHDDMDGNRMVGLSINLGREPFDGGVLEVRRREDGVVVHGERNTGLGDAMLFRISPELEHRVSEVTGTTPRIALTGWFVRTPVYRDVARRIFDTTADA